MDRHIAMETTHVRHHRPSIIDLLTGASHQFDHQRNVHRGTPLTLALALVDCLFARVNTEMSGGAARRPIQIVA